MSPNQAKFKRAWKSGKNSKNPLKRTVKSREVKRKEKYHPVLKKILNFDFGPNQGSNNSVLMKKNRDAQSQATI